MRTSDNLLNHSFTSVDVSWIDDRQRRAHTRYAAPVHWRLREPERRRSRSHSGDPAISQSKREIYEATSLSVANPTDTFQYTVSDGSVSATATVTVKLVVVTTPDNIVSYWMSCDCASTRRPS